MKITVVRVDKPRDLTEALSEGIHKFDADTKIMGVPHVNWQNNLFYDQPDALVFIATK